LADQWPNLTALINKLRLSKTTIVAKAPHSLLSARFQLYWAMMTKTPPVIPTTSPPIQTDNQIPLLIRPLKQNLLSNRPNGGSKPSKNKKELYVLALSSLKHMEQD
jgi:hypothetical protein